MKLDHDQLSDLVRQVAAFLPSNWTPGDHNNLEGPHGMELLVSNGRPYQRGQILGVLPEVPYLGPLTEEEERKIQIGVTLTRPARTIAREIVNRLLPEYGPLYRKHLEMRREHEQFREQRQALADRASELFGEPHKVHAFTATQVDVTLCMNAEQLEAVAKIVR